MKRRLALLVALAVVVLTPAPAAAEVPPCVTLPVNVVVPRAMHQWIEDLIARSPTLQRQCRSIAMADDVIVRLSSTRITDACRARTSFWRGRDGRLRAAVEIPVSVDFAELLAHEWEHVLEQIEGLNLRRLSRHRRNGVWQVAPNTFETARAINAGQKAAAEALACAAAGAACGPAVAVLAAMD